MKGISQFKGETKKKRGKKEQTNRSHSLSKSLAKEGGCYEEDSLQGLAASKGSKTQPHCIAFCMVVLRGDPPRPGRQDPLGIPTLSAGFQG